MPNAHKHAKVSNDTTVAYATHIGGKKYGKGGAGRHLQHQAKNLQAKMIRLPHRRSLE